MRHSRDSLDGCCEECKLIGGVVSSPHWVCIAFLKDKQGVFCDICPFVYVFNSLQCLRPSA